MGPRVVLIVEVHAAIRREGRSTIERAGFKRQPEVLEFLESVFGPYPFEAAGGVLSYEQIGGALECQTIPVYGRDSDRGFEVDVLVHELAHQWFGDSVSLERWRDIWLNEGFATWAEWWWREESGGQSVAETLEHLYSTPRGDERFWNPPPADPGSPKRLFGEQHDP